ncbi:hypothetical protein NY08_2264 [Rhodococcus sp. B7740]|nr:hypothetical protein NY08_2264 [Rhodococcus sp. B7740]
MSRDRAIANRLVASLATRESVTSKGWSAEPCLSAHQAERS